MATAGEPRHMVVNTTGYFGNPKIGPGYIGIRRGRVPCKFFFLFSSLFLSFFFSINHASAAMIARILLYTNNRKFTLPAAAAVNAFI